MKPNSFKGKHTKKVFFVIAPIILCVVIVCVLIVSLNNKNAQVDNTNESELVAENENPDLLSTEGSDETDMEKLYDRTYWQNAPDKSTPLNAENLDNMEAGIDGLDDRVVELNDTLGNQPTTKIKSEAPTAIYNTLSTNIVPLFENGKTYEIEVTIDSDVSSAYVQLSKSQSSGDVFIDFAKNVAVSSGTHAYKFTYNSAMGNDVFLRLYLDGNFTKCSNYSVLEVGTETVWREVEKNANNIAIVSEKVDEIYPYSIKKHSEQLDIVKNTGKFVNASNNTLSTLGSYFYSDFITLNKGQTVTVTSADPSGSAVGRISKWKNETDEKAEEILAVGSKTENTVSYTALTDGELIRFSGFTENTFDVELSYFDLSSEFLGVLDSVRTDFEKGTSISMFENMGICGDSYTAGSIYDSNGYVGDYPQVSWGKVLGRMNNIDVSIFARRGSDTDNWQTREECLPLLLSTEPLQAYVLCLGINDKASVALGTIDDIHADYTQNPNTYYGNYGRIIAQIKAHAPNAVLFISKLFTVGIPNSSYYWAENAIDEIAEHFDMIVIDTADSDFINSEWFVDNMLGSHPTAPLHSGMAKEMTRLISNSLYDNIDKLQSYVGE